MTSQPSGPETSEPSESEHGSPSAETHRAAEEAETADPSAPIGEASPSALAYCVRCGAAMAVADLFCHACGWDTRVALPAVRRETNPSDRNRLAALLLCLLLGWLGAHRFYTGKVGTGIVWLLTLGFFGIGVVYDLVLIATGEFRDGDGRRILSWE